MAPLSPHLPLALEALGSWATGKTHIVELTASEREAMARWRIETAFEDLSAPTVFQTLYREVFQRQKKAIEAVRDDLAYLDVASRYYKGAAVIQTVLKGEPFSVMRDIDILVPPERASLARALLLRHGFEQSDFDITSKNLRSTEPARIAAYESGSYELYAFSKIERFKAPPELVRCPDLWQRAPIWLDNDEVVLLITVDVHLRAANDIPVEPLWTGSPDRPFVDPSVEAWLLATRYYLDLVRQQPRPVLRDLFYLARLFPKADLSRCLDLATRYETLPALFYTYETLRQFGMPGAPMDERCLTLGDRRNDFGWQYGRLCGRLDGPPAFVA
ncbi:hypothetical protein [Tateyamaria sp. ANG-S1]|uniref:hypothetical protein n=1 Tax=Tateyamaria sp. ANG-S1 TaxID=1577905 RepID=UPI00126A7875|nr:hypothetical protein [Tateyamaria sp. ANG-S1]